MKPGDDELMERWRSGEMGAFEMLVRRWEASVARLVARLAGPCAVGDLSQEVFLRVYLAGSRYREQGRFALWIKSIVLNVVRDAARRQRPVVPLVDQEPLVKWGPVDAAEQRETVDRVVQALKGLPDPLREVLVLRHYEGMSFEDIGRLTQTPASTLKSRFGQALRRLRFALRDPEERENDS